MAHQSPRVTLSRNLQKLIEAASPPGERMSARAWALSRGLEVRMISRFINQENSATLDYIDKIAEATGLQPWHLLLEDLDPAHPPEAPLTEEDRELLARIKRLVERPK